MSEVATAVPDLEVGECRRLLDLARETLESGDASGPAHRAMEACEALSAPGAAFVTLRRLDSGELRGCCGQISARVSLAMSVAAMTLASARDDPRFPPVRGDEIGDLRIDITVLGPVGSIRPDEIEIGRHGLLIEHGGRRGLLLPQVAVDHGWDRSAFLAALCQKAGLGTECWSMPEAELSGFEAISWGDGPDQR